MDPRCLLEDPDNFVQDDDDDDDADILVMTMTMMRTRTRTRTRKYRNCATATEGFVSKREHKVEQKPTKNSVVTKLHGDRRNKPLCQFPPFYTLLTTLLNIVSDCGIFPNFLSDYLQKPDRAFPKKSQNYTLGQGN